LARRLRRSRARISPVLIAFGSLGKLETAGADLPSVGLICSDFVIVPNTLSVVTDNRGYRDTPRIDTGPTTPFCGVSLTCDLRTVTADPRTVEMRYVRRRKSLDFRPHRLLSKCWQGSDGPKVAAGAVHGDSYTVLNR
jgi:hypothetical protein